MKQNLIIGCDTNLLFSNTSTQTDNIDNIVNIVGNEVRVSQGFHLC